MPISELILRLGLALAFGTIVGAEREIRRKPAGLRTMMLVSLGAATFTVATLPGNIIGGTTMGPAESSRVIQGIVGGIGFLGTGVILHTTRHVGNITTAASIWVVAALGVAAGLGEYQLAMVSGTMAILTLSVISLVEWRVFRRARRHPAKSAMTQSVESHEDGPGFAG